MPQPLPIAYAFTCWQSDLTFFAVTLRFCEHTMNFACGKLIRHPRIKPAIAGDTTYSVYLLTGTISGSNFAIP
jgi:hypothetical protein